MEVFDKNLSCIDLDVLLNQPNLNIMCKGFQIFSNFDVSLKSIKTSNDRVITGDTKLFQSITIMYTTCTVIWRSFPCSICSILSFLALLRSYLNPKLLS